MKQVKFALANDRVDFLKQHVKFAEVTITPNDAMFSNVAIVYDEANEAKVIQSVFHAGLMCGVDEGFTLYEKTA